MCGNKTLNNQGLYVVFFIKVFPATKQLRV